MHSQNAIVPTALISPKIFFVRDTRVMLDADRARLYAVATKNLNKAVSQNASRFPSDFMFQLSPKELQSLRFQSGTANPGRGGRLLFSLCFHAARRSDAFQRTRQFARRSGKRRDYANFRSSSRNACHA